MLKTEFKKMYLHQKSLLFLFLYLSLRLGTLLLTDTPADPEIAQNKNSYSFYLGRTEGRCSSLTEEYLNNEAGRIADAKSSSQNAYQAFYDGQLTEKEFRDQIHQAEEILLHEKGFELLYKQYSYIRENPENRYFMDTNGWNALLSHDSLDYLLVLLLLLTIVPVYCMEYESNMLSLQLTTKIGAHSQTKHKIVLAVFTVVAAVLADSLMQYLFFSLKYGLPHGSYPLQSLEFYGQSTISTNLLGTFLLITAGRIFGCLCFAVFILFVSVCTRGSYALTLFLCTAVLLLPSFSLPLQSGRYLLPGPLGFMISNGFFRGTEYRYNQGLQEKELVFQEIPVSVIWLLFFLNLLLALAMLCWLLKINTNCWLVSPKKRRKAAACILLCMFPLLCGCSSDTLTSFAVFNYAQFDRYENTDYKVSPQYGDVSSPSWTVENKKTGELQALIRSPFSSQDEILRCIYGNGDTVSYMKLEMNYAQFFPTPRRVSVIEVNLHDFTEKTVFEQNLKTGSNFSSLPEYEITAAFFRDGRYFYFLCGSRLWRVNSSAKAELLFNYPLIRSLSFDGTFLYYINEKSMLQKYDPQTGEETEYPSVITDSFLLTPDTLYYRSRLTPNYLYACGLSADNIRQLTNETVSDFWLEGGELVYLPQQDTQEKRLQLIP